ncbi:PadR family transcriptional regulator [Actinoallomurus purpureus]|uniref:PadR family transcriptional regulator n=1 Tax=Actinoallomurus purpureus TaxID=478114 RepID=UPI00209206A5|nr:PadR family transcriptional regulator [Actinoallomurus purpureus]MCO6006586.1 PadR family transcriptional regulator [Actinoallomurus purpureus]
MSRPLTPLGLAVLSLLGKEPMHPYEMQQRIRDYSIDHVVKVAHGSLYHAVERLARQGLIEPVETTREGRRPERTVYAITEQGRDEADSRLREFLRYPLEEYPIFDMALSFLGWLPPEEAAQLLDRRAVRLEAKLAAHDTVIANLMKQGLERVQLIELEFCNARLRSELEFVRALSDDIKNGRMTWRPPGRTNGENNDT